MYNVRHYLVNNFILDYLLVTSISIRFKVQDRHLHICLIHKLKFPAQDIILVGGIFPSKINFFGKKNLVLIHVWNQCLWWNVFESEIIIAERAWLKF